MRLAVSLLSLGALVLGPGALAQRASGEGFGRWETPLGKCQLEHRSADGEQQPANQQCRKLRLDQNVEGLLSARFVAAGQEMVFAGSLAPGQRPMRCNNQGACQPEWPTQIDVRTVAEAELDRSGLPSSAPTARLAKGSCVLQRQRIQCQALAADGEQWKADSSLQANRVQ